MAELIETFEGKIFNRLTVLSYKGNKKWSCLCECGKIKDIYKQSLIKGVTKSCGCLHKEIISKHGKSESMEYKAWQSMKERCYNLKFVAYKDYGGRGIKVCDEWLNSFENFYKDMGDKPSENHSLDRKNNNKHYTPENCRWVNTVDQSNNRRTNILIKIDGQTLTLTQHARRLGLNLNTIRSRYRLGWDIHDIFHKN